MTKLEEIRYMGKGLVAGKSRFPGELKPRLLANFYGVDALDGWTIGWGYFTLPTKQAAEELQARLLSEGSNLSNFEIAYCKLTGEWHLVLNYITRRRNKACKAA